MTTSTPNDSDELFPPEPPNDALVDLDRDLQYAKMMQEFAGEEPAPVVYRQWEIEAPLGSGSMGKVYLARHIKLGRRVALKLIKPGPSDSDQVTATRFIREAQALAQVDHPNVLRIHQINSDEQPTVIEMEYVEGSTLRSWQETSDRDWRALVSVYIDVGEGLTAIHAAGLLHRDIKPENLLIDKEGRAKVVDLGLAVAEQRASDNTDESTQRASLLARRLTAGDARVGTLGYMAPEVIVGGNATQASDQFSLATALFEAVHGTLPFVGGTPRELAHAIETGELASALDGRLVPRRLRRVLRRGLSFDPDRRFTSVAEFVTRLRRVLGLRRLLLGGMATLALVASVVSITWTAKSELLSECEEAVDAFAANWTDYRRAWFQARAAKVPESAAARSIGLFIATVDAKVNALAAVEIQLCVAERSTSVELDAEIDAEQAACLRYARAHLEAVVGDLNRLDAEADVLAWRHVEAATAIEALPTCEQRSQLGHWRSVVANDELDAALAQIFALETAGSYAEAESLARELLADASSIDPLRHAEARYRLGRILGAQRRAKAATEQLDLARNLAMSIDHDELLCRVVAFQAKLTALVEYDPQAAARELGMAEACAKGIDAHSPLLRADLHEGRGLLASAAGDPEEAARQHRAAMKLRLEHLGREHGETAKSVLNLANALAAQRSDPQRDGEVRALYDASLDLRAGVFGPRHPKVADAAFDLAEFERSRGEFELARAQLEAAESINAEHHGRALARAKIQLSLAAIAAQEADYEAAALALAQASARLDEVDAGVGVYERAECAHLDGVVALLTGDVRRASDSSRRCASLHRQLDVDSDDGLDCVLNEIEADYGLGDFARIAALARDEGSALVEHLATLDAARRGALAWYLGEALMDQGDHAKAATYLRLAISAYSGPDDQGRRDELRELLRHAEAKLGSTPSPESNTR